MAQMLGHPLFSFFVRYPFSSFKGMFTRPEPIHKDSCDGSRVGSIHTDGMDFFKRLISRPLASWVSADESPPETTQGLRNTPAGQDDSVEPDFVTERLCNGEVNGTRLPPLDLSGHEEFQSLLSKVQSRKVTEVFLYGPHCQLLNLISTKVFEQMKALHIIPDDEDPIVFVDHHQHSPAGHPRDYKEVPDILALRKFNELAEYSFTTKKNPQLRYRHLPYHRVLSVIESKTEYTMRQGRPQAVSYMLSHMDARPDMPGLYALTVNPNFYQVLWGDASGICASPTLSWSDTDPLIAYVRSLYRPPAAHQLRDPSIHSPTLAPLSTESDQQRILWSVDHHGKTYPRCHVIFNGTTLGRRTAVFSSYDESSKSTVIIKDYYKDVKRRFDEVELINRIHEDGLVPGVVRLLDTDTSECDVKLPDGTPIATPRPASETVRHRTKKRVVMLSTGEKLYQAKSVKDLLMAIYDAVEVHRTMVIQRRVLHRDVSIHNMMMYPQHGPESQNALMMKDPPKFIGDVLGVQHTQQDKSRALIIDLDNGAMLRDSAMNSSESRELAARTGTPRYIARSVCAGTLLDELYVKIFSKMPELSGKALELYTRTYSRTTYDKYTDKDGTFHGGRFSDDGTLPFHHRPDHDAETIFWVLFVSLILAFPAGTDDASPNSSFCYVWGVFRDHTITQFGDTRALLLTHSVEKFKQALHPRLSSLAPLLHKLALQVMPEYALLSPSPPEDHLHEAFRRLLLEHIVGMDDPIPLIPGRSRADNLKTQNPEGIVRFNGKGKRTATMSPEELNTTEERLSKRARK
ncbi:hypothetical protein K474DRAFT_1662954 [Panus rudis PR-1116 ss-1]|nr:hypothetical protein K474DRAFT_1662954 [Panus rudis PR-1116 ss-1]